MFRRLDLARPRSVVGYGALCGLVAGLVAAVYFSIAGEPAIDDAIAIEEATAEAAAEEDAGDHGDVGHPAGEDHADEGVDISRTTQRGVGLFSAFALIGLAYGLMLSATAFALRGPWLDPFRRVIVAGTILAGAVTVVPWFKYPPNPPAVGDPTTAGERQQRYFALVLVVGLLLAGAAHLSARLRRAEWPAPRRIVVVAAAAALSLGLLLALMPPITDPIPEAVPAALIWRFRVASLGGNLLLWALLTLGFGALCAEAATRRPSPTPTTTATPTTATATPGPTSP